MVMRKYIVFVSWIVTQDRWSYFGVKSWTHTRYCRQHTMYKLAGYTTRFFHHEIYIKCMDSIKLIRNERHSYEHKLDLASKMNIEIAFTLTNQDHQGLIGFHSYRILTHFAYHVQRLMFTSCHDNIKTHLWISKLE